MDASEARRGVPAAHRQFEADHREASGRGDAEAFGRAGAILLGDLLLVWSAEMLDNAGLDSDALARVRPWVQAVRTEVTAGQYLDVLAQSVDPYARTRTPRASPNSKPSSRASSPEVRVLHRPSDPAHRRRDRRGVRRAAGDVQRLRPPARTRLPVPRRPPGRVRRQALTGRTPARTCARASSPWWSSARSLAPRTPRPPLRRPLRASGSSADDIETAKTIIVDSGAQASSSRPSSASSPPRSVRWTTLPGSGRRPTGWPTWRGPRSAGRSRSRAWVCTRARP